jgi:hypothetical protein
MRNLQSAADQMRYTTTSLYIYIHEKKGERLTYTKDETHPTCTRCHKSNLQCGGYKNQTKFVDETYWTTKKHGLISSPSSSSSSSSPSMHGSIIDDVPREERAVKFYSATDLQRTLDGSIISFLRGMFLPRGTDFSSWYLSPDHSDDTALTTSGSGKSMTVMSTSSKRPFLPGVTLQALALGLHGQKLKSHASLDHAAELYGFAVRNLRLDLMDLRTDGRLVVSRRVLPLMDSMLNLSLYEVCLPLSSSSLSVSCRGGGC